MFSRHQAIKVAFERKIDDKKDDDMTECELTEILSEQDKQEVEWHHFSSLDDYSGSLLDDEESQERNSASWSNILYTEEEIHQYMQMPESPAPFNLETIFGTDENTEEQTDSLQNEISGSRLVKRLTPP